MITLVKVDQYFLVFDSVVFFFACFFGFFGRLLLVVLLCQNPLFYFLITTNIRMQ